MDDSVWEVLADDYTSGKTDIDIAMYFEVAAQAGIVLLPDRRYTQSKCGPYDVNDLMLPWRSSMSAAFRDGLNIYPEWFTYNPDKNLFEYTQQALCRAFISYFEVRLHKGKLIVGNHAATDEQVKGALLRVLSIVRKDAGSQVYGTFTALKTMLADDAPSSSKERLSIESLAKEMSARNYSIRYNLISKEYEISGRTKAGYAMVQDDLIVTLHDALADTYKGATFDTLAQYIGQIARENRYNPVLEVLKSTTWDGVNRLPQLYALIGIEEDELSKALVRKWLMQSVALLFNDPIDPFGADGCLVLNGNQGAGKTSLLRHLALRDSWFGEGQTVSDTDKDTKRRIVSVWLAELGEVESTLKSDISALKAFVTASMDHYRLPYGKSDIVAPRLTSLCATCNSDRYLIDTTGNRRWWSIPFNRIVPREEIEALDALQLWAQIYAVVALLDYKGKSTCFRLTDAERADLAARNGNYEKPVKAQQEVEDILALAAQYDFPYKDMTVAEFKEYWPVLRAYSVQQIGAALSRCGIESNPARRRERTRKLPMARADQ